MTLEYRCSHCGWLLQTSNADPLNDQMERMEAEIARLRAALQHIIEYADNSDRYDPADPQGFARIAKRALGANEQKAEPT